MPTSVKVNDLKINRLTEAQYDAAVQAGTIDEYELSIITDLDAGQIIQVDTLPTTSATEEGKIYQYVGVTDANYINGYFYKCVSDGAVTPTYSWERIDVQPSPVVTPQTMPELTVNGWTTDPNTGIISQSVTVVGVTATNNVIVSPAPSSTDDYVNGDVRCVSQSTDTLTFTCATQPTNAITVNVLIL